ncbi:MAG: hypothetical protein ALECFALPRED_002337 [Alectoria fallacina]|uniref:Amidase domain-containing protein n=1 Tax=Alectoria fallacina TaxID=1903189 RepID=A0A8H3ILD3_9LECA|nr:MAG: hypothetical protein ALECFALPRED_002337 [Alectoria fallacina]
MYCPASFTAVYALKPSTGLVSRSGILPSSTTFDAPGMFGRSPRDLANLLTTIAGPDLEDPVTLEASPYVPHDYTTNLASEWSDWRLGIADRDWFWSLYDGQEDDPEEWKMFDNGIITIIRMSEMGANVTENVPIPSASHSEAPAPSLMGRIIRHEMKTGFGKMFSSLKDTSVKSLEDLVLFNHRHSELAFSIDNSGQSYLERALQEDFSPEEYHGDLKQAHSWGVDQGIDYVLDRYNLDALAVPGWSEMSVYAAWASEYKYESKQKRSELDAEIPQKRQPQPYL